MKQVPITILTRIDGKTEEQTFILYEDAPLIPKDHLGGKEIKILKISLAIGEI